MAIFPIIDFLYKYRVFNKIIRGEKIMADGNSIPFSRAIAGETYLTEKQYLKKYPYAESTDPKGYATIFGNGKIDRPELGLTVDQVLDNKRLFAGIKNDETRLLDYNQYEYGKVADIPITFLSPEDRNKLLQGLTTKQKTELTSNHASIGTIFNVKDYNKKNHTKPD